MLMEQMLKQEEIKYALDMQDEIDKENLGLFGLDQETIRPKSPKSPVGKKQIQRMEKIKNDFEPTRRTSHSPKRHTQEETQKVEVPQQRVEIKKECMKCGNRADNERINKLFKIACLAYQPSTILFEGTVFSRKDLISKREEMILNQKASLFALRD